MGDVARCSHGRLSGQAKAIDEARIRALVEKEQFGKVVPIDVNSGGYKVARNLADVADALTRGFNMGDQAKTLTPVRSPAATPFGFLHSVYRRAQAS